MPCSICFGLTAGLKPHGTKSGCELAAAIAAGKCLDCGAVLPCPDVECHSRSHSLAAVWSIIRDRPLCKGVDEARKTYGLVDTSYDGPAIRLREKDVWLPPHFSPSAALFHVVKGVPLPTIVSSAEVLFKLSLDGANTRAVNSLEKAFSLLFMEDANTVDEKEPEKERGEKEVARERESEREALIRFVDPLPNSTRPSSDGIGEAQKELDATRRILAEQSRLLEELRRKVDAQASSIPPLKEIRSADKDVMDFIKLSNPLAGGLDELLKTNASAASHSLDAATSLLKGTGGTSSLSKDELRTKDYAREGKIKSEKVVRGKNGELRVSEKRKKVKISSFSTWMDASLRILELLQAEPSTMADYMAYVQHITVMVEAGYNWRRVYKYDKAYRKIRALRAARWNTDFPHLTEILIRPGLEDKSKSSKEASRDSGSR